MLFVNSCFEELLVRTPAEGGLLGYVTPVKDISHDASLTAFYLVPVYVP